MSSLDDRLAQYLDERESDRGDGITARSIYEAQRRLADIQMAHEVKCEERWRLNDEKHGSAHARLVTVEARVGDLQRGEEVTGSHNLEAIRIASEALGAAKGRPSALTLGRFVSGIASNLAEKWAIHVILAVATIGATLSVRDCRSLAGQTKTGQTHPEVTQ
jgi:hypothetical protein